MQKNFLRTTLIVLILVFFLQGCAATQQRRDVEKSGFLGDYSMLHKGKGDEALLVYVNPNVRWRSYNRIIIDSVSIWKTKGTTDVSHEDLQRLADFLHDQLHHALSQDYPIVTQPGPGVLRASFAITEAEASNAAMDTITSVIPQTRMLTGAKGLIVGGKPGFVGSAALEAKFTDSHTGQLLGAGVDRRGGTKDLSGMTNEWNDVEKAYTYWAGKVRWRLCTLRGGIGCQEPEA